MKTIWKFVTLAVRCFRQHLTTGAKQFTSRYLETQYR
jgi:hypothetical protein